MEVLEKVRSTIICNHLFKQDQRVVVGVSGGPDSVALLHTLWRLRDELRISLHVAHLNHQLRGPESDQDAAFVANLAAGLGLACSIAAMDVQDYGLKHKLSLETAAREVRYQFYEQVVRETGASKVALAHQADDQAETVLLNLLRGTGIKGLGGIPLIRGIYVRPMLEVRRREVEAYLVKYRLQSRQDSSNRERVYNRNKIRLDLLPLLQQEYNAGLVTTLVKLSKQARAEDDFMEDRAAEAFQAVAGPAGNGAVKLNCITFLNLPLALQRRVIRLCWQEVTGNFLNLGFNHVEDILAIAQSRVSGVQVHLPGGVQVYYRYGALTFNRQPDRADTPPYCYSLAVPGATYVPEIDSTFICTLITGAELPAAPEKIPANQAILDYEMLVDPLTVRNRRPGDRFTPYGLSGTVKLKKFFIDQKVPWEEREAKPLVYSGSKLVWVSGLRIAEGTQVKANTNKILHICLKSGSV